MALQRREAHEAGDGGVVEAGEGYHRAPTSHGARVVVAAFGFIEGVALQAVIAVAYRGDDAQAVIEQAFIEHVHGGDILESGHHFGIVWERAQWALSQRITRHEQRRLIAQHERAHIFEMPNTHMMAASCNASRARVNR